MPRVAGRDDQSLTIGGDLVTLKELDAARETAADRKRILDDLTALHSSLRPTEPVFGVSVDMGMAAAIRGVIREVLNRRLAEVEDTLRALGVAIPGSIAPSEPAEVVVSRGQAPAAPGHASISPRSWDPKTSEFTIVVPCTPAKSMRYALSAWVEVDEALSPHGLKKGLGAPVVDVTNASRVTTVATACGRVVGVKSSNQGVELRVCIDGYHGLVRGAVADGRILDVGVSYERLDEDLVTRSGDCPLVNVHRWELKEIRLLRHTDLAEPNPQYTSRPAEVVIGRGSDPMRELRALRDCDAPPGWTPPFSPMRS